MRRAAGLAVVVLAGSGACTTDHPKAAPTVDAGAPPIPAVATHDAGVAAGAAAPDAGVPDAGAEAPAGAQAGVANAPTGTPPEAPERPAAAPKGTVFDRVLAKPKDRGADPAQIKALIEQRTDLTVELTRRTAGRWVLIQLAPLAGGRTEAQQREAMRALERLGIFEVVEGDRLMKVKTP